jgi:hypothetical protein
MSTTNNQITSLIDNEKQIINNPLSNIMPDTKVLIDPLLSNDEIIIKAK